MLIWCWYSPESPNIITVTQYGADNCSHLDDGLMSEAGRRHRVSVSNIKYSTQLTTYTGVSQQKLLNLMVECGKLCKIIFCWHPLGQPVQQSSSTQEVRCTLLQTQFTKSGSVWSTRGSTGSSHFDEILIFSCWLSEQLQLPLHVLWCNYS